uniref:CSON004915 protein n=1 Tax=Culicoides sonorensis TaxID=179676 RepID=A0A336L530_CULSO
MKNGFVFCAVICCLVSIAYALTFEDCGSKIGKFTKIDVAGCNTDKKACVLKRGSNASIGITFETTKPVNKVEALVWGKIAEIDVPFPLPNPNGCTSNVSCPVQPNTPQAYETTLPVLKVYPKIPVLVKWELVNEKKEVIVCVLIPAQIK